MTFVVLGLGIAFVVVTIGVLKLHPFLALILAAILVGAVSPVPLAAEREIKAEVAAAREELARQAAAGALSREELARRLREVPWELQEAWLKKEKRAGGQLTLAVETTAKELGGVAGAIGLVIVLAAIIGQCLMESGAADKITRKLLALLGEKRAPVALLGSGYVLAIPVFFDTVFFLLVPLARALATRTGKHYVRYVLAICAGALVTHALVPPTPGPLVMVENLPGLELGTAIGLGALMGVLPAILSGLLFAAWIDRKVGAPMREVPGSSRQEIQELVDRPDSALPSFAVSILPVVVPVVAITGDTILQRMHASGHLDWPAWLLNAAAFLGNKNTALLLAAFIAIGILMRAKRLGLASLAERLEPSILNAGLVILITSAGGAFGRMLARTGIADALVEAAGGVGAGGVVYILIAWGLAVVMKIAQGSGTVSMITTSAIVSSLIQGVTLPYHVVYLYAVIGFGAVAGSWMNDSGFWVVGKMSGFTQRETLRTWTALTVVVAIVGLIQTLVLSAVLPLV